MFACYTISSFSSYSISFLFILLFFISFCFHLYIRSLNLIHSLCIAPVHSCWHVGVHLLRGFSHRTFTRNFVNAKSFWPWEIFAIVLGDIFFSPKLITVFEPSKNTGLNCVQIWSHVMSLSQTQGDSVVSRARLFTTILAGGSTFDLRLEVYVQRVLYYVRRKTCKTRPIK